MSAEKQKCDTPSDKQEIDSLLNSEKSDERDSALVMNGFKLASQTEKIADSGDIDAFLQNIESVLAIHKALKDSS